MEGLSILNFNVDIISPECSVTTSYQEKYSLRLLLPLIIPGTFLVFHLLSLVQCWVVSKTGKGNKKNPKKILRKFKVLKVDSQNFAQFLLNLIDGPATVTK